MLLSSREVDGLKEVITVETDGVITSRTVNGVEQHVAQNALPSISRSFESRTSRSRTTPPGHSTDRSRNSGTFGASGSSVWSFPPNSASNSAVFKDSKKRSTVDDHRPTASSQHPFSSSVRSEQRDVPASREVPVQKPVPVRTDAPLAKGISVQKEVPTGKVVPQRKDVPAVRKEVPARMKVPEEKEVSVQEEVPMQAKIPAGKAVGQHTDLQDREDKDVTNSTGFPECRQKSDGNQAAEEQQKSSMNGNFSSSTNSNRKTLLYSRVAGNTPIRNT